MEIQDIDPKNLFLVLDFDGVLTDNRVLVSSTGEESVICSRADGLGFDILKNNNISCLVLSSETNNVVKVRCNKLGIECLSSQKNKELVIKDLKKRNPDKKIIYIGNDLNDYKAMKESDFVLCPKDSSKEVKSIADIILDTKGGHGVVREIAVAILSLSF